MELFKRKKSTNDKATDSAKDNKLAEVALNTIHDGIIIIDKNGVIKFINPAAIRMTDCQSDKQALGLDYGLIIRLESKDGNALSDQENPLIQAIQSNQALDGHQCVLIANKSDKHIPISLSVLSVDGLSQDRVIVFRDISKELKEEGEQAEFISTASHEMRTPVATIDGYLSLAVNPQTATIDERARGYLEAAQAASKHLGKLFQDLLDVTKLDDGHIKPKFRPAEMVSLTKTIFNNYISKAQELKITYTFGSEEQSFGGGRQLGQVVYGYVDTDFMQEILSNLIDNALKYTPSGGSVYVNVRGDGDRVLINVTDTGIGISADDLTHIFQKFYRSDNSDTRTIGGTGLGLYIVKQRVESMGGKVWAESAFGDGSTFYVSLPRLSNEEYEKRMIAFNNQMMQEQNTLSAAPSTPPTSMPSPAPAATAPISSTPLPTSVPSSTPLPTSAPSSTSATAPAPATVPTSTQASTPVPGSVQNSASTPVAPAPTQIATTPTQAPAQVSAPIPMPPPDPVPTLASAPPAAPKLVTQPNQIDIKLNGETK